MQRGRYFPRAGRSIRFACDAGKSCERAGLDVYRNRTGPANRLPMLPRDDSASHSRTKDAKLYSNSTKRIILTATLTTFDFTATKGNPDLGCLFSFEVSVSRSWSEKMRESRRSVRVAIAESDYPVGRKSLHKKKQTTLSNQQEA